MCRGDVTANCAVSHSLLVVQAIWAGIRKINDRIIRDRQILANQIRKCVFAGVRAAKINRAQDVAGI